MRDLLALALVVAALLACRPASAIPPERYEGGMVMTGVYRFRYRTGPLIEALTRRGIEDRAWHQETAHYRIVEAAEPQDRIREYRFRLRHRDYEAIPAGGISDRRCAGERSFRHAGTFDEEAERGLLEAATFPCTQHGDSTTDPGTYRVRIPERRLLFAEYRMGNVECRLVRQRRQRGGFGTGLRQSYVEEEVETLSFSGLADARLEVTTRPQPGLDPDPAASTWPDFLPFPGRTLLLSAWSPAGYELLWRFRLDPVSRLPGFAGNGERRDDFARLAGQVDRGEALVPLYAPDGPDLRFHPRQNRLRRLHPDGTRAESVEPSSSVVFGISAMDAGAYGRLRGRVRFRPCENWQPVEVRVDGAPRDHLSIPMDEDGNLMADAPRTEDWPFRGAAPGADDDPRPAGAGPGDGLAAFEEYRGFLATDPLYADPEGRGEPARTSPVRTCPFFVRTSPQHKDLFVHAVDPTLDAMLWHFGRASGLRVRRPCRLQGPLDAAAQQERTDPSLRVVNFTTPGTLVGRGIRVGDQHTVVVVDHALEDGTLGQVVPYDDAAPPWTPGEISQAQVDVAKNLDVSPRELLATLLHELGHAVGLPHHGTGNLGAAVWLTPGRCIRGTRRIRDARLAPPPDEGWRACWVESVARQWGQNSGDALCPMKYTDWRWHELPEPPLQRFGYVDVRRHGPVPQISGPLLRYEKELDEPGVARLCTSAAGSGVNALPGERNHASDALAPCSRQLRVKDGGG